VHVGYSDMAMEETLLTKKRALLPGSSIALLLTWLWDKKKLLELKPNSRVFKASNIIYFKNKTHGKTAGHKPIITSGSGVNQVFHIIY
jgi:hypothetical protein